MNPMSKSHSCIDLYALTNKRCQDIIFIFFEIVQSEESTNLWELLYQKKICTMGTNVITDNLVPNKVNQNL